MVRPERLELPTLCSEGRCSIHLSYGRLGTILQEMKKGPLAESSPFQYEGES
jgi:hypothetical protein